MTEIRMTAIVSLKVARTRADEARERLALAGPLGMTDGEPRSLWTGPDHWFLMSRTAPANELVAGCDRALGDILHNAVDFSAGLSGWRLDRPAAETRLSAGTGIDLRPERFLPGGCARTKLARIPAFIAAPEPSVLELWVDSTDRDWIDRWLRQVA